MKTWLEKALNATWSDRQLRSSLMMHRVGKDLVLHFLLSHFVHLLDEAEWKIAVHIFHFLLSSLDKSIDVWVENWADSRRVVEKLLRTGLASLISLQKRTKVSFELIRNSFNIGEKVSKNLRGSFDLCAMQFNYKIIKIKMLLQLINRIRQQIKLGNNNFNDRNSFRKIWFYVFLPIFFGWLLTYWLERGAVTLLFLRLTKADFSLCNNLIRILF